MLEGILVCAAVLFLAALVVDTWRLGAPPMPSSLAERRAVVALVDKLVREQGRPLTVVEVGAGWGGLALAVVRACPDCTVLAVEGAVVPAAVCWARATWLRLRGRPTMTVRFGDARHLDLGRPDVVVAFLGPDLTTAVADAVARRHPAVMVVSVGFAVRGWTKTARVRLADGWRSEVGLWARAAPAGERRREAGPEGTEAPA